jgi:hypothetical protein
MDNEYLTKQLERRYNSLINLDIKGFFTGLADYVKFIIETPKLISIVDNYILEEKRKNSGEFESLKNKAMKDLVGFGNDLLKEIEKAKVVLSTNKETSQLKELILEFRQLENFKSEMDVDVFERILVDIIKLLRKNKIKNIPLLAQKIPNVNFIKKEEEIYFFPDSYFDYSLERSYYEDLQSKTSWGAWAELYPIYVAIYKRKEWEEGRFPFEPIKKYTDALKVSHALELIDEIFEPDLVEILNRKELQMTEAIRKTLGVKFDLETMSKKVRASSLKEKYLIYLNLVHHNLINYIESIIPISTEEPYLDTQTRVLRYGDIIYRFQRKRESIVYKLFARLWELRQRQHISGKVLKQGEAFPKYALSNNLDVSKQEINNALKSIKRILAKGFPIELEIANGVQLIVTTKKKK